MILTTSVVAQTQACELLTQLNAVAIRLKSQSLGESIELRAAEYAVLEILERVGAITVPQIARERSTSRQNIQILVDRLKVEGRVDLTENPAHKRSPLVRLTDSGRNWLSNGQQGHRHLLSRIESQLSEDEISATVSALRKVHGLISPQGQQQKEPRTVAARSPRGSSQIKAKLPPQVEDTEAGEGEFPVNLL